MLFAFIEREIAADGVAPTFAAMAAHIGLRSKCNVGALLDALERAGMLRRLKARRRAIEIIACRRVGYFRFDPQSQTFRAVPRGVASPTHQGAQA